MMTPLYAYSSTDKNHAAIREAARKEDYLWVDLFRAGEGVPDALVLSKSLRWVTFEIKSPGEKLTPKEKTFLLNMPPGVPHHIIYSIKEFFDMMKVEDSR